MTQQRYIKIEENTKVIVLGFDYVKQQYYVINQSELPNEAILYRKEVDDALQVLLALGITSLNEIPISTGEVQPKRLEGHETIYVPEINPEAIEYVKSTIVTPLETLENMFYTMEDNGSYIKTIQFNEWEEYPMEVDCEKGNILIKNTTLVYPLDINEDPIAKIDRFLSFYKDTLGLDLLYYPEGDQDPIRDSRAYVRLAYWLLANQYLKPHFYNQIIKDEDTGDLSYNNLFLMANYNEMSPVVCGGARNPYNKFTKSFMEYIVNINSSSNTISLKTPIVVPELLMKGSKVLVEGTEQSVEGTTYSADGEYTVVSLSFNDNNDVKAITVEEPLLASYEYPYPPCFIKSTECPIKAMLREDNIIEAVDLPEGLLIGDVIHVENAEVVTSHEIVSLDGEYTVNKVTPKRENVTDLVISMGNNTITLNEGNSKLKVGDIVQVLGTNTQDDDVPFTISAINSDGTEITVEESIPYAYGIPSGGQSSVEFIHTDSTDIIELPEAFIHTVINLGDLINIGGIPEEATGYSNNGLYTILQVVRNSDNTTSLVVDNTVVNYSGNVSITLTPMTPVTLSGSTIVSYNIHVEESVATDFKGSGATFYKELLLSKVLNITEGNSNYILSVEQIPEGSNLSSGDTLFIYIQGNKFVAQISGDISSLEIPVQSSNELKMPPYASISLMIPSESVLIGIDSVSEYLEGRISSGNFLLEDFGESQKFIESMWYIDNEVTFKYSSIPLLKDSIGTKMYKKVDTEYECEEGSLTYTLKFKGLYSDIYKETGS